jgi:site-specific recombinase XerD
MKSCNPKNERVKRDYADYLRHADGKAEQTVRQIEKAILRYEDFTGFADFGTFNQQVARRFKEDLAKHDLAKATIFSTVTALKRFFGWLAMQPGYKRKISLTEVDFLSLSSKDVRAAKAPADKAYPTLDQIEQVLGAMPDQTPIEKRDRALIAFTILTGIRDGAMVTLRLKHVEVEPGRVVQNPNEVATKASKRIVAYFFPVGAQIEQIVIDWVRHLREELLFGDDDPLFPKSAMSHDENMCFVATGLAREFWSGAGQVRGIFKAAFERAGLAAFTPHSFRNTLVQIAYQRKLSHAEMKAWSQNLGHESILTTLSSYGKIPVEQQGKLVRQAKPDNDRERPVTAGELEAILRKISG